MKIKLPGSVVELDIEESLLKEIDDARGSKSREEYILDAIHSYMEMLSV